MWMLIKLSNYPPECNISGWSPPQNHEPRHSFGAIYFNDDESGPWTGFFYVQLQLGRRKTLEIKKWPTVSKVWHVGGLVPSPLSPTFVFSCTFSCDSFNSVYTCSHACFSMVSRVYCGVASINVYIYIQCIYIYIYVVYIYIYILCVYISEQITATSHDLT